MKKTNKVKNRILLNELFPEFTSDKDLELIDKWSTKKRKDGSNAESLLILPDEREIMLPDDFDINELMNSALDPVTGTLRNLKIDDRDLPRATNYYDYSYRIIGKDANPPWARQMWTGLMLFGECCVTPDTLLTTNKGLLPIVNICTVPSKGLYPVKDITTITMDGNNEVSLSGLTRKQSPIVKVTSRGEIPLKCTPDHKLLVLTPKLKVRWIRADTLTVGDLLISKVGANLWPSLPATLNTSFVFQRSGCFKEKTPSTDFLPLTEVTPELARLVGYIITDGSIEKHGITFCNEDRPLLLDFLYCMNSVFKLSFAELAHTFRIIYGGTKAPTIKFCKYTSDYLQSLGFPIGVCYTKNIPDFILQSSSNIVANCMQAMFDSDGWVDHAEISGHRTRIGIALTSEKAVQQVHLLLKNMGIDGDFQIELRSQSALAMKHEANSHIYTWKANSEVSRQKFAKYIGSKHSKKSESIRLILKDDVRKQRRDTKGGKIPAGYLPWYGYPNLKDIVSARSTVLTGRGRLTRKETEGFDKYLHYRTFPKIINLTGLLRIRKFDRFMSRTPERNKLWSILSRLKAMNYSFSPVVMVEDAGISDVYDITVPKNSSFQANGVIIHNCTACTKEKYLHIESIPKCMDSEFITDVMTLLENGICPKCGRHKWDLIKNHNLKDYQQLCAVLGQRSGKSSSTAGGYATYMVHQYLKFPDLSTLAKSSMQASTLLTGTFVSLNFGKAVGVLWTPFAKMIESSRWFCDFFKMLDYYKQGKGTELYRNSSMYLEFYHKNFRFYPSGPRSTTLRGDTRIFGELDELGLFPLPSGDEEEDEQSERANADEAHKSLARSLTTVQGVRQKLMKEGVSSVPGCVLMNVSSPIAQRDKMMRLLRQSKTEEGSQYILGINLSTWEVNPDIDRDHPTIRAAYSENPEKAERDYGANPPSVHSQFIPRQAFENDVFVNGQNSHNFKYMFDHPGQIYGKVDKIRSSQWPSLISIDAGAVNNSFTITAAHYNFDTGKTIISTLLECMPQGRRINFNLLYQNVILPVARDVNAVAMLADQWQGIDLLHRIEEDMGNNPLGKVRCKSKQHSPRRKDFDNVVSMFQSKNVLAPTISEQDKQEVFDGNIADYRTQMLNKPVQHLFLQLNTVQDIGISKCPQKGESMTDDIFRALVLCVSKIHEPKIMDRLKEAVKFNYGTQSRTSMPMPGYAGRSGGRYKGL